MNPKLLSFLNNIFTGCSNANRISKRDFITAQVQQFQRDVSYFFRADWTLVRTTNDAGYVTSYPYPIFGCKICDFVEPVNSAISLKVVKARSIKMCRASLKNFAETNISKVSKEKITENFKLSNLKFYKPLQTFVNRAVDVFPTERL